MDDEERSETPSETSSETGPGSSPSLGQAGDAVPQVQTDLKVSPEKKPEREHPIFNDSVHGTITLHPLLVKIIDTPEFQRLRNIKQLGAGYRVYPAAAHNRFEHSIGVCYLAGVFVEKLRDKQPELDITATEVLCVKIAGLCHDIGHGPFSHLFDKEFREVTESSEKQEVKHEEISKKMIRHLFKDQEVWEVFEGYGLENKDVDFICDLIDPKKQQQQMLQPDISCRPKRYFLYEIVSNKNGIDVDRWDYFARDCLQLGLGYTFDYRRCMEVARVIEERICFRDKEEVNIFNMFVTRYNLYRCAYFHTTNSAMQLMIADSFKKADRTLKFEGEGGQLCTLSTIHEDMKAFTKATDSIYYDILNWSPNGGEVNDGMRKAQKLLNRIEKRDFYELIADVLVPEGDLKQDTKQKIRSIKENIKTWLTTQDDMEPSQLRVQVIDIGFGAENGYPLKEVYFFKKGDPTKSFKRKREDLPKPIGSMVTYDIRVRVFSTLKRKAYEAVGLEKRKNQFKANLKKLVNMAAIQAGELTEDCIRRIMTPKDNET